MYLLSTYNSKSNESWKKVGQFLKTRSSTQIRTHVQKFRIKLESYLKDINSKIENVSRCIEEGIEPKPVDDMPSNYPPSCLETTEIRSIENYCNDYLKLYQCAINSGVKYEDDTGKHTFQEVIEQNKSIPNFIFEIGK